MASRTLYPPIVKDYEPAFVANNNSVLKVYFNLSSLTGDLPQGWNIQAQIIRKDGVQVINTVNDPEHNRYRATGIILNMEPIVVDIGTGLYYVTIVDSDLKSSVDIGEQTFNGFIPGWTYKIQLRISTETYDGSFSQEAWLQQNSSNFSEWSTICFTKAISQMIVENFNFVEGDPSFTTDSIEFNGRIISSISEVDEDYYTCRIYLFKAVANNSPILIEDSGLIFNNEVSNSYFSYTFKHNLIVDQMYKVIFSYITENDYIGENKAYYFTHTEGGGAGQLYTHLATLENDPENIIKDKTNLGTEEDEGRIGLKLYYAAPREEGASSTSFYIRRASSRDNFSTWEDIYKLVNIPTEQEYIDATEIFYDYTIESGIWYKYAIQAIVEGERGPQEILTNPIIRNFNFSYLLGYGDRQLKLEFNNIMGNFNVRINETKSETIGSKYPYFNRNSILNYKNFPVTGLISFQMDEQNTFLKNGKNTLYKYDDITNLYNNYNNANNFGQYDYIYEREFRKLVIEFLTSGKVFLFKSPTEGNILVRIMDCSCTPNQTLGRLIYDFSSNASEADEYTLQNCLKYGLFAFDKALNIISSEPANNHIHILDDDTPRFD